MINFEYQKKDLLYPVKVDQNNIKIDLTTKSRSDSSYSPLAHFSENNLNELS